MPENPSVFCPACVRKTEHTASSDGNKELLFVCTSCKSFTKLPAGTDAAGIRAFFDNQEAAARMHLSAERATELEAERTTVVRNMFSSN